MIIEKKTAVGIYSDSGLNGVEVALVQTDGLDLFGESRHLIRPYPADLREKVFNFILKGDYTRTQEMIDIDTALTDFHFSVYQEFRAQTERTYPKIDVIGYSGHVVYHKPKEKISIALGNPQTLANQTKTAVVSRFIQSDLKQGGHGGPLFASYYGALTQAIEKPLGILSIGGIITLTVIGPLGELQAFDVGIGTALLDYWIMRRTGAEMDFDGLWATKGKIDERLAARLLKQKYYAVHPPKTVNKNDFIQLYSQVEGCSVADGAATLTAVIARSIQESRRYLTMQPVQWVLIGGGTYNPEIVRQIKNVLPEKTVLGKELDWNNDTLNAQSYAFLSVRSLAGLPISFEQTTGVNMPTTGGRLFLPE